MVVRWTRVLVGLVAWLSVAPVALAIAQTPVSTPPAAAQPQSPASGSQSSGNPPDVPVSLDRIRDGLEKPSTLTTSVRETVVPTFRVEVIGHEIKLEDYWKVMPETGVSRLVRPSYASQWHHDFMTMTTPKDYRASLPGLGDPVHPVGIPVLDLIGAFKSYRQNRGRGRAKEQVQRELQALEAARAAEAARRAKDAQAPSPDAKAPDAKDPQAEDTQVKKAQAKEPAAKDPPPKDPPPKDPL